MIIFSAIEPYELPEWLYSRTVKTDIAALKSPVSQLITLLRPYRDQYQLWLQQGVDTDHATAGTYILVRGMLVPPPDVVERVDQILAGLESGQPGERFMQTLFVTILTCSSFSTRIPAFWYPCFYSADARK